MNEKEIENATRQIDECNIPQILKNQLIHRIRSYYQVVDVFGSFDHSILRPEDMERAKKLTGPNDPKIVGIAVRLRDRFNIDINYAIGEIRRYLRSEGNEFRLIEDPEIRNHI